VPPFDLRTQPKAGPTGPEVENGSRHIRMAPKVEADSVAMGKPEDQRYVARVNQLF
jgi:hypothetical protein